MHASTPGPRDVGSSLAEAALQTLKLPGPRRAGARLVVEPAREMRPQPGAMRKVSGGQHLRLRPAVRHTAMRVCLHKFHALRHMRHLQPSSYASLVGRPAQMSQQLAQMHSKTTTTLSPPANFLLLTLHVRHTELICLPRDWGTVNHQCGVARQAPAAAWCTP